jgi:hypothetical protein
MVVSINQLEDILHVTGSSCVNPSKVLSPTNSATAYIMVGCVSCSHDIEILKAHNKDCWTKTKGRYSVLLRTSMLRVAYVNFFWVKHTFCFCGLCKSKDILFIKKMCKCTSKNYLYFSDLFNQCPITCQPNYPLKPNVSL